MGVTPMEKSVDNHQVNDFQDEEDTDEKSGVTWSQIWRAIKKHWIGLVVSVCAGVILSSAFAFEIKKPKWSSTGSMIVLAKADSSSTDDQTQITAANLSLSLSLVPTIVDIMGDSPVQSAVAKDINTSYNSQYTATDIGKMVTVKARTYTSSERSLYIDITASTSNKDLSISLVDATITETVRLAKDKDQSYSNLLSSLTTAHTASEPVDTSMSRATLILIGFVCGLVVGCLYGIIFEFSSKKVNTSEELESLTGVKVLGMIPDASLDSMDSKDSKKTN